MPKTKINERESEKQSNLFDEETSEQESLTGFDYLSIEHKVYESAENKKFSKVLTILRQGFLFAPGAVLLWVMSWGITEGILTSSSIPLWAYLVFILSFFMTTLGLSDVRKPKNFLISGSNVLFGIFFGITSGVFTEFLRLFVNYIGSAAFISLAPIIWIIPLFTKLWLEKIEKEKSPE